ELGERFMITTQMTCSISPSTFYIRKCPSLVNLLKKSAFFLAIFAMFIIIFFIDKDETEEFTKVSTTDVSDDERKDESNDEYAIVDVKGEVIKPDRKSTRLNSSHVSISYAVFCL